MPPFDTHTPLLSLPRIFETTLETIPARIPYLSVDSHVLESWRSHLGRCSAFKVGIAWQGNPEHVNDYQRSVPLASFAPLAEVPGVQLYSLQKGKGTEQLEAGKRLPIVDLSNRLSAFQDTGAALQNLDLLITVDTAVARLRGALGVPAWVLLRYAGDWRWLTGREDSPWYPTMRLFRQTEPGNWNGVMNRVNDALRDKLDISRVPRVTEAPAESEVRPPQEPPKYSPAPTAAAPALVLTATPDHAETLFQESETLLARPVCRSRGAVPTSPEALSRPCHGAE